MNYQDYQNARDAVWNLLIAVEADELPIKVTQICHALGIQTRLYAPKDENDGMCLILDGQPVIFVSTEVSIARQRFTAAHELGHILLGHVGHSGLLNREPKPSDNPIEQAANVFASRLLAPACVLWGCGVGSADEIAQLCNISQAAAEFRWARMQVLYQRGAFLSSTLERQVYRQFRPYIDRHRIRRSPAAPGAGQ